MVRVCVQVRGVAPRLELESAVVTLCVRSRLSAVVFPGSSAINVDVFEDRIAPDSDIACVMRHVCAGICAQARTVLITVADTDRVDVIELGDDVIPCASHAA